MLLSYISREIAQTYTLELDFERIAASTSIKAVATLRTSGGIVSFDSRPTFQVNRGSFGSVTQRGNLSYECTLTPNGTTPSGEYVVTVSGTKGGNPFEMTRTPVIFTALSTALGVAMKVEGYVNTPAVEDGAFISTDGRWLGIHYLPTDFSNLHGTTAVGPMSGPERPNMPGQERMSGTTINAYSGSTLAPSAMYIFERQSDGSYRNPKVVRWTGGGGQQYPFGGQIQITGETTGVFFFKNDGTDIQRINFTLGDEIILGVHGVSNLFSNIGANFGGNPGNPHVHMVAGAYHSAFADDENVAEASRIIRYVTWNGSAWSAAANLPASVFNTIGQGAIQPWFNGSHMIWREGHRIRMVAYLGGAMSSAGSWGTPITLVDNSNTLNDHGILSCGEPTVATINGVVTLCFCYLRVKPGGAWENNVALVPWI